MPRPKKASTTKTAAPSSPNVTTPTFPFKPMFDRIIVVRDAAQSKVGALFIPNEAKEAPNIGTVLAVGEGRLCNTVQAGYTVVEDTYITTGVYIQPLRVRVGDRVLFQSYAGTEIKNPISGDTVLVMTEDDVLCVIDQPPTPSEPPADANSNPETPIAEDTNTDSAPSPASEATTP